MHKVDLRNYGEFWTEFVIKFDVVVASPWLVTRYLKDSYGITAHVTANAKIGEVYMMPQEYTAFLLKWG